MKRPLRSPVACAQCRTESRVTSVRYGGSLIVTFCPIFARRRSSSASVALPWAAAIAFLFRACYGLYRTRRTCREGSVLGGVRAAVPDTVSDRRQRNGPCLHVPVGLSQKGRSASLLPLA